MESTLLMTGNGFSRFPNEDAWAVKVEIAPEMDDPGSLTFKGGGKCRP